MTEDQNLDSPEVVEEVQAAVEEVVEEVEGHMEETPAPEAKPKKAEAPALEILFSGHDRMIMLEGIPFKVTAATGLSLVLTRQDIKA